MVFPAVNNFSIICHLSPTRVQFQPLGGDGMKIGILSDTHNDSSAILRALQVFRMHGVRTLFHCGDLTTADMVPHFTGFEVYFVRGNMDRHHVPALKAAIGAGKHTHWLGKGGEVTLDSKRIAITHGDREDVVETLLYAQPDYLFLGHMHRLRDQRVGSVRVINPGALGGTKHEPRSVCVLDLTNDKLDVIHM
jgi:putative phosphoesterase